MSRNLVLFRNWNALLTRERLENVTSGSDLFFDFFWLSGNRSNHLAASRSHYRSQVRHRQYFIFKTNNALFFLKINVKNSIMCKTFKEKESWSVRNVERSIQYYEVLMTASMNFIQLVETGSEGLVSCVYWWHIISKGAVQQSWTQALWEDHFNCTVWVVSFCFWFIAVLD